MWEKKIPYEWAWKFTARGNWIEYEKRGMLVMSFVVSRVVTWLLAPRIMLARRLRLKQLGRVCDQDFFNVI